MKSRHVRNFDTVMILLDVVINLFLGVSLRMSSLDSHGVDFSSGGGMNVNDVICVSDMICE